MQLTLTFVKIISYNILEVHKSILTSVKENKIYLK